MRRRNMADGVREHLPMAEIDEGPRLTAGALRRGEFQVAYATFSVKVWVAEPTEFVAVMVSE
jgi:hypothetical protein